MAWGGASKNNEEEEEDEEEWGAAFKRQVFVLEGLGHKEGENVLGCRQRGRESKPGGKVGTIKVSERAELSAFTDTLGIIKRNCKTCLGEATSGG